MQIYIMDSDYEVMKNLELLINIHTKHKAKCFTTPQKLVDAVKTSHPEIVVVDVDNSGGSSAVKNIRLESPESKIIIASEERGKVIEYFKFHANGFLLKPIDEEKLDEQLFRVNHPLLAKIKYGTERIE